MRAGKIYQRNVRLLLGRKQQQIKLQSACTGEQLILSIRCRQEGTIIAVTPGEQLLKRGIGKPGLAKVMQTVLQKRISTYLRLAQLLNSQELFRFTEIAGTMLM